MIIHGCSYHTDHVSNILLHCYNLIKYYCAIYYYTNIKQYFSRWKSCFEKNHGNCHQYDNFNEEQKIEIEYFYNVTRPILEKIYTSNYIDPYIIDIFIKDNKRFNATFKDSSGKDDISEGYLELLRNKWENN